MIRRLPLLPPQPPAPPVGPPRDLVLRAPIAAHTIVEVWTIGDPINEAALGMFRQYLEIMQRGYDLSTPPEAEPPAQQPEG